jgi:replicative DNA helicase
MSEKNFGYLGTTFQQGLLKTIIEDKKFAVIIIDVIKSAYFDGPYFKYLMENIKELYDLYNVIPSYDTLQQKILAENINTSGKVHIDTLADIKNLIVEDNKYIKKTSLNFCRQQVVKKALKESDEIIQNGAFEEYNRIETLITDALQVGATTDDISEISTNIRESLQKDARVPFPTGINGIDDLLKGGLARGELGIILAPTGIGKELPISEPILTPKGWIKNGELKVGDKVIGSNGCEQYVLSVYPQGIKPIYKVEFTDNTFVNCGLEHLWLVNTLNMRTAKTRGKNGISIYKPNLGYKVIKTSDMMSDIKKRGRYNYRLPIIEPVQFEDKEVLIDPYLLGLLLGDGCLVCNSVQITTKDDDIFDNIKYLGKHTSYAEYQRNIIQTIKTIRFKSCIKEKLEKYNLIDKISNNKFIPFDYLYNSVNVRLSVLQGLMDTDGHVSSKGITQITTVSEQLSRDIREIVLSLGGTARISTKNPTFTYKGKKKIGQVAYIVTISFANSIVPFRLIRKINRYRQRTKYKEQKFVKSIIYSHNEEALCIKVSNSDNLYVTRDYVLTHNTTILTKFANAGYIYDASVLQIIFEDNPNEIRKKHYTIWTGIAPDDQQKSEDEVVRVVTELTENHKNRLYLLKLHPFGVSVADIRNKIRKLESEGKKIDLLILDYLDCISLEKSIENGDEWKGEGTITRTIEAMASEFNIAIWTATQGNRESMSAEVVTTDQMGGNIKKAQIGHVVISIAKSLPQKEHNLANITLLKSRIGKDGIVFQNCKFDNEYLQFDTDAQNTLLGHEEERAEAKKQHAADVYKESLERKSKVKREVEESRLKLEFAVSKTLDEKDQMNENLNQLQNFEESKESEIELPPVEDIKIDNVPLEILSSPDEPQLTLDELNRKHVAEVYKMSKLKSQQKVDKIGINSG